MNAKKCFKILIQYTPLSFQITTWQKRFPNSCKLHGIKLYCVILNRHVERNYECRGLVKMTHFSSIRNILPTFLYILTLTYCVICEEYKTYLMRFNFVWYCTFGSPSFCSNMLTVTLYFFVQAADNLFLLLKLTL